MQHGGIISSQLCHMPALGPWTIDLTSLSLYFLICEMGIINRTSLMVGLNEINMQRAWHGAWHINNTMGLQISHSQEDRVPSCSQSLATLHPFIESFILQISVDQKGQVYHRLRRQK